MLFRLERKGKGKDEIQGFLHCGGKCAAFGRNDVGMWSGLGRTGNCNGEMRGSLHSATDGKTVCCFGRDDVFVVEGRGRTGNGKDEIQGSFTSFRMTTRTSND